jgi:hypothetical protein
VKLAVFQFFGWVAEPVGANGSPLVKFPANRERTANLVKRALRRASYQAGKKDTAAKVKDKVGGLRQLGRRSDLLDNAVASKKPCIRQFEPPAIYRHEYVGILCEQCPHSGSLLIYATVIILRNLASPFTLNSSSNLDDWDQPFRPCSSHIYKSLAGRTRLWKADPQLGSSSNFAPSI